MKNTAIQYYELGLKPTCISYLKTKYNSKENNPEKSPCHPWKRWQIRKPDISEVKNLNWEFSNGIGAVLGLIHRCIDIDNCDDYEFVMDLLKSIGLPKDYEWVVKTPSGFHIHLHSGPIFFATNKELINGVLPLNANQKYSTTFSKIELRWANHIVLPPTIINGKKYSFVNTSFPNSAPIYVSIFDILMGISKFCGVSKSSYAKIETQNMTFQLCAPSEGYPHAEAMYGTEKNEYLELATNSVGYINYEKVPKNKRAGYIEFSFGKNTLLYNWSSSPFFLDIETTGLINNPLDYESYPRIIQISYYDSYKREIQNIYIKPDGFEISPEIEKLTGLTKEFLEVHGVNIKDALYSIELNKHGGEVIVGHNIDFDLSVIDSEYIRFKKNSNEYIRNNPLRNGAQVFCTMKKFSNIFNVKYPKLTELYEYFFDDMPSITPHNAKNDLEILIDCYKIMDLYGYIIEDHENQIIV